MVGLGHCPFMAMTGLEMVRNTSTCTEFVYEPWLSAIGIGGDPTYVPVVCDGGSGGKGNEKPHSKTENK